MQEELGLSRKLDSSNLRLYHHFQRSVVMFREYSRLHAFGLDLRGIRSDFVARRNWMEHGSDCRTIDLDRRLRSSEFGFDYNILYYRSYFILSLPNI